MDWIWTRVSEENKNHPIETSAGANILDTGSFFQEALQNLDIKKYWKILDEELFAMFQAGRPMGMSAIREVLNEAFEKPWIDIYKLPTGSSPRKMTWHHILGALILIDNCSHHTEYVDIHPVVRKNQDKVGIECRSLQAAVKKYQGIVTDCMSDEATEFDQCLFALALLVAVLTSDIESPCPETLHVIHSAFIYYVQKNVWKEK